MFEGGSTSLSPGSRVTPWRSDLMMSRPCAAARECPGSRQVPEACSFLSTKAPAIFWWLYGQLPDEETR